MQQFRLIVIILVLPLCTGPLSGQAPVVDTLRSEVEGVRAEVQRLSAARDSLDRRLMEFEIAEDYFQAIIGQQATIFSVIVGVVVTVGGLLGWSRVRREVRELEATFRSTADQQRAKHEAAVKRLEKAEVRIAGASGNVYALISNSYEQSDPLRAYYGLLCAGSHAVAFVAKDPSERKESIVISNSSRALSLIEGMPRSAAVAECFRARGEEVQEAVDRLQDTGLEQPRRVASRIRVQVDALLAEFPEGSEDELELPLDSG